MELRLYKVNTNVSSCVIIHLKVSSCLLVSTVRAFSLTKHKSPHWGFQEVMKFIVISPLCTAPPSPIPNPHPPSPPAIFQNLALGSDAATLLGEDPTHDVSAQCREAIKLQHFPQSCSHRQTGKIFYFLTSNLYLDHVVQCKLFSKFI